MPETLERTPQAIGPGRITFGKARRARIIAEQVAGAHAALAEHEVTRAALGKPTPTGFDVVRVARTFLGKPYCAYGCRCQPDCRCNDCSGLICAVLQLLGLPPICTSSFGFAQICQDQGLAISRASALVTPGTIAIRNPFGQSNGTGSNGHIVILKGDNDRVQGDDSGTVEERGRAYGCVEYHEAGRGFTFWAKLPGIAYVPPAPPKIHMEPTMFVQLYHYNEYGDKVSGPCAPPSGHPDEESIVRVSEDGKSVQAWWGASIANDKALDDGHPFVLRVWRPTQRPLPTSAHFESVYGPVKFPGDDRTYGVASVSDGTTRKFRLS